MDKTILEISTELLEAAHITPEEAKKELAIRLYQLHKLNDKQAAELAGDPKAIETLVWSNTEVGHFDLDHFLSWASHDLKTPLNAVIGFTKLVIKGIDGPINEIQNTDLTTAFNGGKMSFSDDALKANFEAFVDAVVKAKPAGAKGKYLRKAGLSSSMGPGLKLDVAQVYSA